MPWGLLYGRGCAAVPAWTSPCCAANAQLTFGELTRFSCFFWLDADPFGTLYTGYQHMRIDMNATPSQSTPSPMTANTNLPWFGGVGAQEWYRRSR